MGQKVLVFESDATFAADLRNELTKLGCNVQVVDDGNAGLQQATSARPDLILLSIELPRMNGFSVCNKLKKDPSLKDVPLIIMSSESSDETFEQHRKLRTRAEDYVHKPITFDDLLARITPFVALRSEGDGVAASAPPAAEADYRSPQETSADHDDGVDHPTGHPPPHHASVAPTSADAEELEGDILIEEMPSQRPGRRSTRPPVAGDLDNVDLQATNTSPARNGSASLDAALRAVSEAPIPRTSDRPARISSVAPSHDDGAAQLAAGLQRDVEAAQARIRDLEDALERARSEAASAAENAGSVDTEELDRLRKDNEDLKTRLVAAGTAGAAKGGGVSSRDFLDLREALNKKDKEILSLREGLAKKDKEIVDVRDKSLAFERLKADLDDKVLEQERDLAERQDKIDSLQADKEQAKKAGDDFKRRAERAQADTEAAKKELADFRDKHAQEIAAREADVATLKEEHAQNVEIERKAREATLAEAEARRTQDLAEAEARRTQDLAEAEARRTQDLEEAATEKQTALDEAQRAGAEASAEALATREKALTTEHESKLATLHRAHQDEAQRLRTEHEQKIEALGTQHEEATAEAAKAHEAALVELRAELESERDGRIAEAEAKAVEKIATIEKDFAEKIAAAELAGATRAEAAESDAAAKIRAAEHAGAAKVEAAEKDAAERISRAEEQAASARTASDAQIAGLEDDLAATRSKASTYETRVTELEAAFASTAEAKNGFERDLEAARQRLAILEADLAATRYSLDETKGHLVTQTARLEKATTKIEADKTSLDRAKDALAVALSQIEEAESRSA